MMCGLFGFYGTKCPDPQLIETIGSLASKRGPDGWGIVTEFDEHRDVGRLPVRALKEMPPSRLLLGHCRLSTVPETRKKEACQPIRVQQFRVAHNGTVRNAWELAKKLSFEIRSGNDSEAIGHLISRLDGPVNKRIDDALRMADMGEGYALAVLDTDQMEIHLRAKGIPLWRNVVSTGFYWCSIRPDHGWEAIHA